MSLQAIKAKREKRAKLVADARTERDKIKEDTPEAEVAEIEARFDQMMDEADKLGKEIEREERLHDAERELEERVDRRVARGGDDGNGDGNGGGGDGGEGGDEAAAYRDAFLRMVRYGAGDLSPEERTVLQSGFQADAGREGRRERRAQSTSDAAGGYTIPEGFWAKITETMKAFGPMWDPNVVTIIDTDSGNTLPWPTMDETAAEGEHLDENTQVSEDDITFGQKSLGAHTISSKLIRVSLQLLQDSAFNFEAQIVNPVFGMRIARGSNRRLTTGTGSGQAQGIVTGSSAGVTAAAGTITFDNLVDLEHSVDPAYRSAPGVRWMLHDTSLKIIKKLKDSQDRPLWLPGYALREPDTILGKPYSINQHMDVPSDGANKTVLFGDMKKYIVRRVRGVTIVRLVERYADYLQVGFIGFARYDGLLEDTSAVKHLVHQSG